MPISDFTNSVIKIIKQIPKGKVTTYGNIAVLAGNPRSARQVSWILHSSSQKYDLPWHRVINSKGIIAMKSEDGKNTQKELLEMEGIEFINDFKVNLKKYQW
ncbi:MGMT family protein [Promethearchaeum syntrophicum]|uniref:MGMT family protein n=1 Tax=Promethearchaeum syntrophicum TaxID=2594042 RepID=A0A5B9DEN9_9ARCH|nr:methylated-DNA--protein-cysteine methyltransferase [Candidatus Prometheoarchaeum syntrophicum]